MTEYLYTLITSMNLTDIVLIVCDQSKFPATKLL